MSALVARTMPPVAPPPPGPEPRAGLLARMTVRQAGRIVAGGAAVSILATLVGLRPLSPLLALIQLGFLIGLPIALALRPALRWTWIIPAMAVVLSVALTALTAQFLVWFEIAEPTLVVALASFYGLVVALLLDSAVARDGSGDGVVPVGPARQNGQGPIAPTPNPADRPTTTTVGLSVAVLAVILAIWGGITAPTAEVDGYGLISALPLQYWVAVGLAVLVTVLLLRPSVARGWAIAAVPATWLGVLHTAPHLAHDHFRFQTAWTHLGFVRLIDEQGTGQVLVDARFAWPGFFASFVPSLGQMGDTQIDLFMRLWPTLLLGVTAALVAALANRSYPTVPMVAPVAATIYLVMSWTGQDYFSPQSFGFAAYLCILVLIESGSLQTAPAWSESLPLLKRFSAAGGDRPRARSTPVFVAMVILALGAVVSHPLAPFFICIGLAMLGLYGRTTAWRLMVFVGVIYVAWFFVTAEPWWSTQLPLMLEELGDFFENFLNSSTERQVDSSPERLFVTQVRAVYGASTILAVLAIGVAMAFNRFAHLRPAIPLAPLAGIPSLALLQSYGGEVIFRVILFTLPPATILLARVLVEVRPRLVTPVVAATMMGLSPVLLVARFGNEAYEKTTAADLAVFNAGFARAQDDTVFVLDNGFAPYQASTVGRNRFAEIPMEPTQDWLDLIDFGLERTDKSRVIVFLTPGQAEWRVHGMSSPPDYLSEMGEFLKNQPDAVVLYEEGDSLAIEIRSPDEPETTDGGESASDPADGSEREG